MKILILASARSGSTILVRSLANILRLYPYGEPFNEGVYHGRNVLNDPFKLRKSCIVKSLIEQVPSTWKKSDIEFYKKWSDSFDHIILLTRKNIQETYESYSYCKYYHSDGHWPFKYWYKEPPFDEVLYKFVQTNHNKILRIGEDLNIPITYYEDLYSGEKDKIVDTINKWNLKINWEDLFKSVNPKLRYRQSGKEENFI